MKRITTGLTPTEFLAIVNQNFIELADIRAVGHYSTIVPGDDIVSKINTYYGSSIVNYGSSSVFKSSFEAALISQGCLIDPSGLTLTWMEDFLRISFTDNNGGATKYEIYESVSGGAYGLVTTLDEGILTYDYHTWQNASLNFKIRAKKSIVYSDYSTVVNAITPFVFKCDQSVLTQVYIKRIALNTAGKTVIIYWGDGNHTNFSATGDTEITHDYSSTGQYWIWFTGDVNNILAFEFYNQSYLHDTVMTKWKLPTVLVFAHFYGNGMIGDITNIIIPANCGGAYLSGNAVTCDLTHYDAMMPYSTYWDIHLQSSLTNGIYGVVTDWVLPLRNAHINIYGVSASGNLTAWTPWQAVTYADVLLNLAYGNFTGDLSGWTIPDLPASLQANTGCHFTKLPRGNFRKVSNYEFVGNSCNTAELDNILAYIDSYFAGGIVPLVGCTYYFYGASMGIPSAAGLVSKASIEAKYAAVGKSIAIVVNT